MGAVIDGEPVGTTIPLMIQPGGHFAPVGSAFGPIGFVQKIGAGLAFVSLAFEATASIGAGTTTLATLPASFAPARQQMLDGTFDNGTPLRVDVMPAGTLVIYVAVTGGQVIGVNRVFSLQ